MADVRCLLWEGVEALKVKGCNIVVATSVSGCHDNLKIYGILRVEASDILTANAQAAELTLCW